MGELPFVPLYRAADPCGPNPFKTDSPRPPADFEHRRQEDLPLHRQTEVICKVVGTVWAVGRVPGRGSAVLVSASGVLEGVVLTTPAVLPTVDDARGASVVFFEDKVLNGRKKPAVCEAPLRPDRFFYSSLPEDRHGEKLRAKVGYVLCACEMYGSRGGYVEVAPLELPLLRPSDLRPKEGDIFVAIQHPDGRSPMKYHVNRAASVRAHHVELERARSVCGSDYSASGGAVFDAQGRFVGIGHMQAGSGGANVAILIQDVVTHMFHERLLGALRFSVRDVAHDCQDRYDADAELIESKDLDAGFYWEDLWKAWVDPGDYRTISLCLFAWPLHAKLQVRGLTELTSHTQRAHIHTMCDHGAVDAALRALQNHPGDSEVAEAAVLALGRSADSEGNRAALQRLGALGQLLKAMEEFAEVLRVQQWACCCMLQLARCGPQRDEAREGFAQGGGLKLVAAALERWPQNAHLTRWAAPLLGAVCEHSAPFVAQAHAAGLPVQLLHIADGCSADALSCEAALHALCALTADWGEAQGRSEVCAALAADPALWTATSGALVRWSGKDGGPTDSGVLLQAALLLGNVISCCEDAVVGAIDADIEHKVYDAAEACPVSGALLSAASDVCSLLGVDVDAKFAEMRRLRDADSGV
eukprot:TRINITY_DN50363_c0_g1_i1.p1 TRINITY_DN50363_c0_g1~~TRINITY_DN50363_c0_g1_i1.p1  ORF type:complete len:670 (+),score=188.58 TRINITY_DN50363_c0_g1_i1:81-2012(+)